MLAAQMRSVKPMSAVAVSKLAKPGRYAVGDGAYLQIATGGTKAWVFRYAREGKARHMGLGPYDLVTLAEAREKAREARKALLDGADPLTAKRDKRVQARLQAAKGVTFEEAAERVMASHGAAWKNFKHRQQWRNTLATYAYPHFGELSVAAIDTGLVLKALEPIWRTKPETASRVRGRIEAVLDWAKARGYREGDNPARWRGHLDKLLPNRRKLRKVRNHPAMPYPELPAFMAELRDRNSVSANALEFCVLTAARTGEVIGARWPEIDLEAGIWTVPAERMKVGREHRIPLSKRALDILATLPREAGSEFVFMGAREGKPLSNIAMLELLRGLKPNAEYVPHGFRSSFRDWAAEQTSYPSEVVEMALAHTVSDKTIAAYKRTDLFERRARLMNDWGSFCANPLLLGDVVQLRKPVA
jgi:integrase